MFYKIIHCFQLWTKNMHSTYTWELYAPEQLLKANNPVFDLIISVSTYIGKCSFISKFSLSNLSRTAITELTKKKELKARILPHNFITELFAITRWCIPNSTDPGIRGSRPYSPIRRQSRTKSSLCAHRNTASPAPCVSRDAEM